ncbi:MAG: hypothetical protein IPJ31_05740 [Bacteroidetes bacterium]|nr:hypothetical protein [Bacteroidota bacterium]
MVFTCFSFTNIQKVSERKWQGIASYYHSKFEGRKTSTGEIFSNRKLTAANNFLKLGTKVRVTNLLNGKSVIVKINDRMNKKTSDSSTCRMKQRDDWDLCSKVWAKWKLRYWISKLII